MERRLDDIVDVLRNVPKRGCSLLIGAGCSATAGVETAAGFVKLIKDRFGGAYARASEKTYPKCMAGLSPGHQRDLISEQVANAKINWAHMAMAQLIRNGYVDRVLTTNFDPLVLRACAMLGEFPAVYDFAVSQFFRPGELPKKAIFHLHGQSTGFVLMNTDEEVRTHSERLGPLFQHAGEGRPWIVVGYSGDSDPVFHHLAAVERFAYCLFWIGFKDEEPKAHVREKLLLPGKDAFFVRGYDADRFFVELAQKLECFPPDFVQRPFSFLKSALSPLTEYRLPYGDNKKTDVMHNTRDRIDRAIAEFEEPASNAQAAWVEALELAATALLMAGKHRDLKRLAQKLGERMTSSIRDTVAWSFVDQGSMLSDLAKMEAGAKADALFRAAGEKYAAALAIKSDKHEALNNWGNALSDQATSKAGEEADTLFEEAYERYEAALAIEPDDHEALGNWGLALSQQAKSKTGEAADALFEEAYEKYAAALAFKPDDHQALNKWGFALSQQAKRKANEQADTLYREAYQKYQAAMAIKPDHNEALNNWGSALSDQATSKAGEEADALFRRAYKRYVAALAIRPDDHEALYNWGTALLQQAKTKAGEEADTLFHAAGEKYAKALAVKPDKNEALINWGIALFEEARTKVGGHADALFRQAVTKYAQALAIKPNDHEALNQWGSLFLTWSSKKQGGETDRMLGEAEDKLLQAEKLKKGCGSYNLACVAARRGNEEKCLGFLKLAKGYGNLPDREHLLRDPDLASVRHKPWFRDFLARL